MLHASPPDYFELDKTFIANNCNVTVNISDRLTVLTYYYLEETLFATMPKLKLKWHNDCLDQQRLPFKLVPIRLHTDQSNKRTIKLFVRIVDTLRQFLGPSDFDFESSPMINYIILNNLK